MHLIYTLVCKNQLTVTSGLLYYLNRYCFMHNDASDYNRQCKQVHLTIDHSLTSLVMDDSSFFSK